MSLPSGKDEIDRSRSSFQWPVSSASQAGFTQILDTQGHRPVQTQNREACDEKEGDPETLMTSAVERASSCSSRAAACSPNTAEAHRYHTQAPTLNPSVSQFSDAGGGC